MDAVCAARPLYIARRVGVIKQRHIRILSMQNDELAALTCLPADLLLAVLGQCDVVGLGRAAACCSAFARLLSDTSCPLWPVLCQRQGLATEESGAPPRDVLRRAALCRHATDERPASSFEWQCVLGRVQSRCRECSRIFGVSLSNGCMDTPSFASKLVTRAEFRALHEAPRHDRLGWQVVWDRRHAAAAQPAMRQAEGSEQLGGTAAAPHGEPRAAGEAVQSRFESLSFGPRYSY